MVVKTFRGLLADGGEDRIRLQTIKGKVGYRIVKFNLFPIKPGSETIETTASIFKTAGKGSGTSVAVVDFTDNDLLGAAYYADAAESGQPAFESVFFDQEIFNQDIYINLTDTVGSESCNYYIELEVIPLDDAGAEYTTLKDMRQS